MHWSPNVAITVCTRTCLGRHETKPCLPSADDRHSASASAFHWHRSHPARARPPPRDVVSAVMTPAPNQVPSLAVAACARASHASRVPLPLHHQRYHSHLCEGFLPRHGQARSFVRVMFVHDDPLVESLPVWLVQDDLSSEPGRYGTAGAPAVQQAGGLSQLFTPTGPRALCRLYQIRVSVMPHRR